MDSKAFLETISKQLEGVMADLNRLSVTLVSSQATASACRDRLGEIRLAILKRAMDAGQAREAKP